MTGTVTFSLLVPILLGATLFVLPYFTPRRFFFTVTVAPEFPASEAGRSILRGYHVQTAAVLVVSLLAVFAFSNAAMVWVELLLGLGGAAAFLYARSKVSRSSLMPEAFRQVDLDAIGEHLPRWILWALPPFLFPPATAAWLRAHWSEIPQRFPYHWNAHGEPNAWTIKSERAVYGPLLFCAGIMLLVLMMSIDLLRLAPRGAAIGHAQDRDRSYVLRRDSVHHRIADARLADSMVAADSSDCVVLDWNAGMVVPVYLCAGTRR